VTAQALLKLKYEVNSVIPMKHAKPSLRIVALVDTRVHEAWKEGTTQPQETERMGLEEGIQQGSLRLHTLKEERGRLRKKSTLMGAKVKKMEDVIKKDFLGRKTRMVR